MTRTRRGFTLVEALVVLVVLSAVLATVGLTMHTLLRSSRNMQNAFRSRRQIERFTWQLRTDAHQATSATVTSAAGDNATTVLQLQYQDARRIDYEVQAEQITRTERRGADVTQRESYPVTAEPGTGWRMDAKRTVPLVSLLLRGPTGPRKVRMQCAPIEVVTAVNLHGQARKTRSK